MVFRQPNKYHNKKVGAFDSKKELKRYHELTLLEKAGHISDLRRQVTYELIPSQKGEDGKTIERPVKYIADFVYTDNRTGQTIVEDTKSPVTKTKDYIIKRKLMLYIHGIRIKEI